MAERLTCIDHIGWYVLGTNGQRLRGEHIDRLAKFEDTRVEPSEILTGFELAKIAMMQIEFDRYHSLGTVKELSKLVKAKQDGRLAVLPCKEFYEKAGDTLFLIDDGEIIEVVYCGAQIDADGQIYGIVVADNNIFPYREPIAEYDTDPSDWCTNAKNITPNDFGKTVFLTHGEAETKLAKESTNDD